MIILTISIEDEGAATITKHERRLPVEQLGVAFNPKGIVGQQLVWMLNEVMAGWSWKAVGDE